MAPKPNPHFFTRGPNGQAVIRLRFTAEEASMIEEAAGRMPLIQWLYATINEAAREQSEQARQRRPKAPPPA